VDGRHHRGLLIAGVVLSNLDEDAGHGVSIASRSCRGRGDLAPARIAN
jgi:hypothetical protein